MESNLLFVDDTVSEPLDKRGTVISALTSLLVPLEKISELRSEFYDAFLWFMREGANVYNFNVPELHGRELLPGQPDDRKFEMIDSMVKLVVGNRLRIIRVGYYVTKQLRELFESDTNMVRSCWFGVMISLQPVLASETVIPVMDMGDRELGKFISRDTKGLDLTRAVGLDHHEVIRHSKNILGEVFYAESAHSVFTQVVDIVSYLRLTSDMNREGKPLTGFKKRLLAFSQRLEPAILRDKIYTMTHDGQTNEPSSPRAWE